MPKAGTPFQRIDGHLSAADGRQMAADMLREFRREYEEGPALGMASKHSLYAMCRADHQDQDTSTLRRWLDAYATASPKVKEGFLQVLTEFFDEAVRDDERMEGVEYYVKNADSVNNFPPSAGTPPQ